MGIGVFVDIEVINATEDIASVSVGTDVLTSEVLTVVSSVFVTITLASSGGGVVRLGLCPQADINVVISTVIMIVRICASL